MNTVVIGLLGTNLDARRDADRWQSWRPSVALCRQPDMVVNRFELIHGSRETKQAEVVKSDIESVSPETEVRLHTVDFGDPWDFEAVYDKLFAFARTYPFDEGEDYLIHITTGTHVAQICLFLLTETRWLPGRLIQGAPDRKAGGAGQVRIIDLDLSRYDGIASRFQQEQREATSFLKSGIETRNVAFNRLIERIEQVAMATRDPLLLMGPTGAGKSRLAKRIYELKKLRHTVKGPLVSVNCATLRGDGAMSTLFGHKKGAFTGALADRPGLLRSADGGLLFLDEIGELGLDEQAMLLRAVEDKTFLPLGSDREVQSDFQLIAGTNRDLTAAVREGRFREDLLARINLWTFALPGLRERPEDIEPNLQFELEEYARRTDRQVTFSKEARRKFLAFAQSPAARWAGNFRDLNAAVTRMAVLSMGGRISEEVVEEEIERLQAAWRTEPESRLEGVVDAATLEGMDLFDRLQLGPVLEVCAESRSLSEAGRRLFGASRTRKATANDADRLRKYLARFGLEWPGKQWYDPGRVRGFLAFLLLLASPPAGFVDATARSGIGFRFAASKTASKYLIEAMGGGVALFDADGDGRLDLFLVNGAALRDGMTAASVADKTEPGYWNRLYRNEGEGRFRDITEKAGLRGTGYGQGVAVGDCDNDGRPDLFVTSLGANQLYRNVEDGRFEDVTEAAGVRGSGWSTSAGFVDFDRDGKLDLFVARYLEWDFGKNKPCGGEGKLQAYCHPNEYAPVSHLLYRNQGGCRFEDVTVKSGVAKAKGKGLGVAFEDFDRDGRPDIFVANDSFPQQLFRNRGDGTFEETALQAGLAYDDDGKVFAGMGITVADYDQDGWPDVFVNALANQGYALFRNVKGLFEYVSPETGLAKVTKLHSGWGTRFLDFDNDGWKDLFVAQGHVMDNIEMTQPGLQYLEKPLLARNMKGQFIDVSASAGAGFAKVMSGRGAAFGDWNNDGAIDIAIGTNDGSPRLLQGAPQGNWLMVRAVGTKSNRDGLGAAVRVETAHGGKQFGTVTTAGSYLSAHDPRVHFGLGTEKEVSVLEVTWPSGQVQTWKNVAANQVFVAQEKP